MHECPLEAFLFWGKRIAESAYSGDSDQKAASLGLGKTQQSPSDCVLLLDWKLFAGWTPHPHAVCSNALACGTCQAMPSGC